jgi:hypothetical protein
MKNVLMKCGCAANGYINDSKDPVCCIHIGIHPGATQVAEQQPDLTGRKAHCAYGRNCRNGNKEVDSSLDLAFFEYHPDEAFDIYYCGCRGWD